MAKRIYIQTVIAVLLALGIGTYYGPDIFLYFNYAESLGVINITGYSGDMICTATDWKHESLCYAYLNFTALEDNFWYPVNYDPYGRTKSLEIEPGVKDWKIQRSWGKGWRDIPMNKTCTGTWCGGKFGAITNAFSIAWREGRDYQVRVVAIKNDAADIVKWSFGNDVAINPADPVWDSDKIEVTQLCQWKDVNQTIYGNVTYDKTCQTDNFSYTLNPNMGYCWNSYWIAANSTWQYSLNFSHRFDWVIDKTIYWNEWESIGSEIVTICNQWQGIEVNGKYEINWSEDNYNCAYGDFNASKLFYQCDRCGDDGNCDGIVQSGESYCNLELEKSKAKENCISDTPKIKKDKIKVKDK